jgi:hypothetical protein
MVISFEGYELIFISTFWRRILAPIPGPFDSLFQRIGWMQNAGITAEGQCGNVQSSCFYHVRGIPGQRPVTTSGNYGGFPYIVGLCLTTHRMGAPNRAK